MGIPPVKWEKSRDTNDPLSKTWGWPLVDNTVEQSQKGRTMTRKLVSRDEIPVSSAVSLNVILDNAPGVICNGLLLLSKIVSLWASQSRAKGGEGGSRRLHARAWTET